MGFGDRERLEGTGQTIVERVRAYLPAEGMFADTPSEYNLGLRAKYRRERPGAEIALSLYNKRLIFAPPWAGPLTPSSSNSTIYGTNSMETLSVEPVIKEGRIVGANIILLGPRMDRLYRRSLRARIVKLPIARQTLAQGIIDLVSVLGSDVLKDNIQHGLASIRVGVGDGIGPYSRRGRGEPNLSVEVYSTKRSLPERAYTGDGLVISAGPDQRFKPLDGKLAAYYADGARELKNVEKVGADDGLFFATREAKNPKKTVDLSEYKRQGTEQLKEAMLCLAIAGGFGSEILAVTKDGTILLPPIDKKRRRGVNRLGGVTADYVMKYLAPALGFRTREALFSLEQVKKGEIVGLFLAGNAARIARIGKIVLHDASGNPLEEISLTYSNTPDSPDIIQRLINQFELEVSGIADASHSSLLTPVDLEAGREALRVLEDAFSAWL